MRVPPLPATATANDHDDDDDADADEDDNDNDNHHHHHHHRVINGIISVAATAAQPYCCPRDRKHSGAPAAPSSPPAAPAVLRVAVQSTTIDARRKITAALFADSSYDPHTTHSSPRSGTLQGA